MILLLIVKILIAIVGLFATGFFWLIGLTNHSKPYVKTAGFVLLTTVGIIGAITAIEFLLM